MQKIQESRTILFLDALDKRDEPPLGMVTLNSYLFFWGNFWQEAGWSNC